MLAADNILTQATKFVITVNDLFDMQFSGVTEVSSISICVLDR